MNERVKLLKKAVLTSVGATSNVDRIKTALDDAMRDLVKVGQGLLEDLEEQGKVKTDSAQEFLKKFQAEATKKSAEAEKTFSAKVQTEIKKAAHDFGLVTLEDWEELSERLAEIEEHLGMASEGEESGNGEGSHRKRRGRSKKN